MGKIIFFSIFPFVLLGCFSREKAQAINTLRDIAEERAAQEVVIRSERKQYQLLLKAIEGGVLRKGLSESDVRKLYGEPLIEKPQRGGKTLVFSDPSNYIGKDKVYIYFDQNNELSSWEVR